jgi:hypothetical protein
MSRHQVCGDSLPVSRAKLNDERSWHLEGLRPSRGHNEIGDDRRATVHDNDAGFGLGIRQCRMGQQDENCQGSAFHRFLFLDDFALAFALAFRPILDVRAFAVTGAAASRAVLRAAPNATTAADAATEKLY